MKILKENLPWIAPTAALLLVATGAFDSGENTLFDRLQGAETVQAATPATAAPQANVVALGSTIPTPQTPDIAGSTADQLSAIVDAATAELEIIETPEVARAVPLSNAILPEIEPDPVVEASTDPVASIGDDPAAFFANAQANLAASSSCGDDLRALASEARIYFPSGGLAGADAGLAQARLIGQVLRDCPGYSIQVEGHSDPSGDPQINLELSAQRAEAVVARLAASGIDTSNFIAKGFGDTVPSNVRGTQPAAYYDRRVEFSVVEQVQRASFAPAAATPWQSSACAESLNALFDQTKLYYAPGSITVPHADMESVFNLAAEAASCGDVRVRIVGQHADQPGSRESVATGRLRALAVMNTLVAAGFQSQDILIGAPSWSVSVPGQPGLPNSRVDFEVVPVDG